MSTPIKKVKHYEILKPIGKGGMGEVYLAQDTILDRKVAIKFLPEEMRQDQTARLRFVREAKSAAALDHPFICKVYEAGEVGNIAYIIMEYIEGESLSKKIKDEPLPLRDALNLALETAEALEKAHKSGIVHRDLKPANIMITPQGRAKVMDFGLAKKVIPGGEEDMAKTITHASLTEQGMIAGTLAYMSPEQARAEDVDQRSDIFALGIVLQEMVSGTHPFTKTSAIETLSAILRDPAPYPNLKPKVMNPLLSPILNRALAKNPDERYQDITDLANDIRKVQRQIIRGQPLLRRGLPVILAGIFIIALVVLGTYFLSRRNIVTPTEAMPDPTSVLVADFQNKTGDSVFDGALEDALNIGLEGASFITAYKRPNAHQVAKQLDPGTEGRLDSQMAQLICVREGISMFIDGAIEPKDDGYLLKVWAKDPVNPENITEFSKSVPSKGEVLNAAAWLANKVRESLGDKSADARRALSGETFTTSSLIALNSYTHAQELNMQGKQEEAIAEYLRAIKEDPNFGRAYSGLALIYQNRGQFEEADKYFKEALARIDRMTEREKYRTRSIYYLIKRNIQKAIEECEMLVNEYPADFSGQTNLAVAYFFARNYSRAKEVGRQAVDLYPKIITSRFNLAWYALADGDFEMADQEAQKVIDQNPEYDEVYMILGLSRLARGQLTQAIATYEKLKTIPPLGESLADLGLADIALYEGRLSDAVSILEKRIDLDTKKDRPDHLGNKWSLLAFSYLLGGKKALAIEATDRAVDASKGMSTLFLSSLVYIQANKQEKARVIAEELSNRIGEEPRAYAKLIEGEIALQKGKVQDAIELFKVAQEILDTWFGRFVLGRAYLNMEAFPDAHAEFEACLERHGEATSLFFDDVPSYHMLPQVYYYLGRAQEGLGSPAASESYQKYLQIKKREDWGDPLVKSARARLNLI